MLLPDNERCEVIGKKGKLKAANKVKE